MGLKQLLFSFDGRLRRRDWWIFYVAVFFVNYIALQIVAPLVFGAEGRLVIEPGSFAPVYPMPLLILTAALTLVWLWPNLAVAVKRGHDRGLSAGHVLGLYAVSMVVGWTTLYGPAGFGLELGVFRWIGLAINTVIGLYFLVVLGFLDGTPGPNRYGPSPKGLGPQADAFT